jgi:ABC-2 type transport system permease protein
MISRMNPWRLEWLRMTRSSRGLALVLVYLFFGFTGPLTARYLPQIAKLASSGVQIIAPPTRPVDGIVNYVSQTSQTGLLVVIVVAAGALSFDARRGLATFYRTRAPGPFALVWPRFVSASVAATLAYLLGTAAAWLETVLVLGDLPPGPLLFGTLCEVVFLGFAVATVAAVATFTRGTLGTVGTTAVVLLLVLPLAGAIDLARPWLPSTLMRAPAALVGGAPVHDYLGPLAVSVLATAALLALAVRRARHRETA